MKLSKDREKLLEKLDGEWNSSQNHITAIKDVKNLKGTKYGDKVLENHSEEKNNIKPSNFVSRDDIEYTSTLTKAQFLELKNKIRKMTKSNKIRTFTGVQLPEITVFFRDDEYRGALVVAPRIQEDFI